MSPEVVGLHSAPEGEATVKTQVDEVYYIIRVVIETL